MHGHMNGQVEWRRIEARRSRAVSMPRCPVADLTVLAIQAFADLQRSRGRREGIVRYRWRAGLVGQDEDDEAGYKGSDSGG